VVFFSINDFESPANMDFEKLFTAASAVVAGATEKDEMRKVIANVPRPRVTAPIPKEQDTPSDRVSYKFEIPDEYDAVLIKPEGQGLVKIARKVYMAGAGNWLVGVVESSVLIVVPRINQCLKELDDMLLRSSIQTVGRFQKITPEAISDVIQYSVVFELNRTYRWISIGPDIFTLSVDDIIKTRGISGHKNVAVITVDRDTIHMQVRRFYPINAEELRTSKESGFNVVVLPGLTDGLWVNASTRREVPMYLRSPQALAEYWEEHHGYRIPLEVVQSTVDVCLATSGLDLTYPAVCVWRHKWSFLPHHTHEYLPVMRERITRELADISKLWSGRCSRRKLPLEEISMPTSPKRSRKTGQKC
jgi:hypothetical protein